MKLSHLKALSWTVALAAASLGGAYTARVYQDIEQASPPLPEKWEPKKPEIDVIRDEEAMSRNQILQALAKITKTEPPPPPPPRNTNTAPPPIVEEKVEIPKLELMLKLIAYDEKGGEHMVFINSPTDGTHPFIMGETVYNTGARITEILRDSIILTLSDGQKIKLKVDRVHEALAGNRFRPSPVATVNTPPERNVTKKDGEPPKPPAQAEVVPPSAEQVIKYRTIPRERKVSNDDRFGIDVVEYDPGGEVKRYAISEEDKRKLEDHKWELLSQVAIEPAYGSGGSLEGLRLGYMVDDPLLKSYGFDNGDVVTHINNQPIKSQSEALDLYNKMDPNTRRVRVDLTKQSGEKRIVFLEMDDFKNHKALQNR